MPRPQKYDWDDKRDICYKLYVEEKLSGQEVVRHFAKHFNLPESELPTAKQFNKRFKVWGFPDRIRRLNPETEPRLVERTTELFKQNLQAQQILEKLNDEGWELDAYHFRVLRKKHGLIFRALGEGYQPTPRTTKRKRTDSGANPNDGDSSANEEMANEVGEARSELPPLPPEEAARRAQRLADLQVQSDHLMQTRKRRRRIRGFGHLPPDAPGMQPRYNSETSLDECKAFLHLTNEMYAQVREEYERICREMGIIKMSLCAEGQWQASKDRLVRENMHLSSVLHPLQPDLDKRANALNCICSDVTKRMRTMEKTVSIADANNILGLDPVQSKDIRRLFYEILAADHFTTVVACGKEHLDQLQEQWYAKSDVLQRALSEGNPAKARAIFVLAKDVRKRYGDDQSKKDPSKRSWQIQKHYGPGPGPARGIVRSKEDALERNGSSSLQSPVQKKATNQPRFPLGPAWEGQEAPEFRMSTISDVVPAIDFEIDPLLSETTHGPPWPPQAPRPASAVLPDRGSTNIPAYFCLAPGSQLVGNHPRMWLGKLSGSNMEALRRAATSKAGAARVAKVNGIAKNVDGSEDSWLIETDDELGVYLEEAGEKATFSILLVGGYA